MDLDPQGSFEKMNTYRFEVTAHEEIDIEAKNKKEAEEKARAYW